MPRGTESDKPLFPLAFLMSRKKIVLVLAVVLAAAVAASAAFMLNDGASDDRKTIVGTWYASTGVLAYPDDGGTFERKTLDENGFIGVVTLTDLNELTAVFESGGQTIYCFSHGGSYDISFSYYGTVIMGTAEADGDYMRFTYLEYNDQVLRYGVRMYAKTPGIEIWPDGSDTRMPMSVGETWNADASYGSVGRTVYEVPSEGRSITLKAFDSGLCVFDIEDPYMEAPIACVGTLDVDGIPNLAWRVDGQVKTMQATAVDGGIVTMDSYLGEEGEVNTMVDEYTSGTHLDIDYSGPLQDNVFIGTQHYCASPLDGISDVKFISTFVVHHRALTVQKNVFGSSESSWAGIAVPDSDGLRFIVNPRYVEDGCVYNGTYVGHASKDRSSVVMDAFAFCASGNKIQTGEISLSKVSGGDEYSNFAGGYVFVGEVRAEYGEDGPVVYDVSNPGNMILTVTESDKGVSTGTFGGSRFTGMLHGSSMTFFIESDDGDMSMVCQLMKSESGYRLIRYVMSYDGCYAAVDTYRRIGTDPVPAYDGKSATDGIVEAIGEGNSWLSYEVIDSLDGEQTRSEGDHALSVIRVKDGFAFLRCLDFTTGEKIRIISVLGAVSPDMAMAQFDDGASICYPSISTDGGCAEILFADVNEDGEMLIHLETYSKSPSYKGVQPPSLKGKTFAGTEFMANPSGTAIYDIVWKVSKQDGRFIEISVDFDDTAVTAVGVLDGDFAGGDYYIEAIGTISYGGYSFEQFVIYQVDGSTIKGYGTAHGPGLLFSFWMNLFTV